MTAPIEDVRNLPGKTVTDQDESQIGEITEIYAMSNGGQPMWVAVELGSGLGTKRTAFIPLARLKEEDGALRVPYSREHISEGPQVDGSEGISAECDRKLRDFYGIDAGDQELRSDNKSYATLVPEDAGASERVEDVEQLSTPDADTRTEETTSRLQDPGSRETRKVTADDVADEEKHDQ